MGVLIDADHLFDYYNWYGRRKTNKIVLFLHAWEYSIAGLLVSGLAYYHPVLLAVFLAHLGHVTTDHFHNHLTPWSYFITYRAYVRFETAQILPHSNVLDAYKAWTSMLPFSSRIEPWYQRKIEPWFRSRIDN